MVTAATTTVLSGVEKRPYLTTPVKQLEQRIEIPPFTTKAEWLAATRSGNINPSLVLQQCTLSDEEFDEVLINAYEATGGVPGF